MSARDIARGGLLTAAAVALLYLGGAAPWMGVVCCILAGVASAVPLMRLGRVKMAVLLYLAACVLSALLAPRKSLVISYAGFFGLYPILKYGIEARVPRHMQRPCKLVYFNLALAAAFALVRLGLFFAVEIPGFWRLLMAWFAANVVFEIYDVGLSRLIAALRKTLPPE
ncbi:MAG: hypothetical protein Q4C72_01690 [Eubacteriales bacterium]|nr:hypothetical protein [Eubacteriales bacterium]